MSDLATMIAEIEADTERSDTAAIRVKINSSIRHYQPHRFWFNESRDATFNTVVGQTLYGLGSDIPANFYHIDGVWLTVGTNVYEVARTDYRALEQLLDGTSTPNQPTLYSFINGSLRFFPEPNDAYQVRVTGHIKLDAPATDVEANNPWMTQAYDLIMARAKAELYAHRWEDPGFAQLMRIAEEEARSRLVGESAVKTGTGAFVPTQF